MSTQLRDRLQNLLEEIGRPPVVKSATSAGVGKTTSLTDKLDGGNHDVQSGDRSAENDADLRKRLPGANVLDSKISDKSNYNQSTLGPKKSPTGEDPSTERDFGGRPVDSPTSSPVSASAGEKYANLNLAELHRQASLIATEFLAKAASLPDYVLATNPATISVANATTSATNEQAKVAAEAGYNLAASVIDQNGDEEAMRLLKQAANSVIASAIQEGYDLADLAGQAIHALTSQVKKAEDTPPAMAGGLPPDSGAPAAPTGPVHGSHGDDGGQLSPEDEHAINEIANALHESGMPVEEILALLASGQDGGEGGAPGAAPPEMPEEKQAARKRIYKVASAVDSLYTTGKFRRVKVAKGTEQAKQREQAVAFIVETLR